MYRLFLLIIIDVVPISHSIRYAAQVFGFAVVNGKGVDLPHRITLQQKMKTTFFLATRPKIYNIILLIKIIKKIMVINIE